ncbi:MAG: L,D-transpeptidase [Candidatus Azobacteroides sp.]|nr:L,D-transpeptidase [Candidatus Azobacteroides sp.]
MKKKIALWVVLLLPYAGLFGVWRWYEHRITKIEHSSFVVVSKEDMTLTIYNYTGKIIGQYPVACGKSMGNKTIQGDMKTPEGIFPICDIQNASEWKHDFGDGRGSVQGAYGPFFIRLFTPGHQGIGIHGTVDDESIGTRATEGCIRLRNKDLKELVKKVKIGDVVIITPSKQDVRLY